MGRGRPLYDGLGRVVTTTFPDGSTSQAAYHGLVTTITNGLNQTRTVTKDSGGQTVSVTDAAGKNTQATLARYAVVGCGGTAI